MLNVARALLVGVLWCSALAAASAPRLSIIDLRAVNNAQSSRTVDVNNAGVAIGTNFFESGFRPFVYSAQTGMQDFGSLIGAAPTDSLNLWDINNRGEIVGEWNSRPILYSAAGGAQFLGTQAGVGTLINDAGQALVLQFAVEPTTVLFTPGLGETVVPLRPGTGGTGGGLNDVGFVTGNVETEVPWLPRPAIWSAQGGLLDLGLPPGHVNGIAQAINNAGTVVGYGSVPRSDGYTEARPWRYTQDGGFVDLLRGEAGPADLTMPTSIDDDGLVTGWFLNEFGEARSGAFLYHDSFGLVDANTLLSDADAATWSLQLVGQFNSAGVAATYALVDGVPQLALLQMSAPVPEPTIWSMVLLAAPAFWRRALSKRSTA